MISIIELDRIIPVNPPIVNINKNPVDHKIIGEFILYPLIVINHLKILIPVGITIINYCCSYKIYLRVNINSDSEYMVSSNNETY